MHVRRLRLHGCTLCIASDILCTFFHLCFLSQAAYTPAMVACTLGSALCTPGTATDTLYTTSGSVFSSIMLVRRLRLHTCTLCIAAGPLNTFLYLCFLSPASYTPTKVACTLGAALRSPGIANHTLHTTFGSVFLSLMHVRRLRLHACTLCIASVTLYTFLYPCFLSRAAYTPTKVSPININNQIYMLSS